MGLRAQRGSLPRDKWPLSPVCSSPVHTCKALVLTQESWVGPETLHA